MKEKVPSNVSVEDLNYFKKRCDFDPEYRAHQKSQKKFLRPVFQKALDLILKEKGELK